MIKDRLIKELIAAYGDICALIEPDGSVLYEDGYSIYAQLTGYYFAFMFVCEHPENPYFGDKKTYERAASGWDHYRSI